MKTISVFLLILALANFVIGQPHPLDFYPHHVGDVWQYRSLYTGELVATRYLDSIRIDSLARDIFIYFRPAGGGGAQERIDSTYNLYELNVQTHYPRYKLAADSGESWIAGYRIIDGDTLTTFIVSVSNIFQAYIFDSLTTVKVFRFEMINECCGTFWLGNDYLAAGFGWVRSDIEPSDSYVLTGAIIGGVRYGVIVGVSEDNQAIPQEFQLYQNYPNPFNSSTTIRFSLPQRGHVALEVFDGLGRVIWTPIDADLEAGDYTSGFDGLNLPSGAYVYRLRTSAGSLVKKMMLLK